MRKIVKRALASIFAATLVLGGVNAKPVEVKAATDKTAFLMFTDRDWAYSNMDSTLESATTTVNGDGSYSVTLNAAEVGGDGATGANGAMVFCVDIVGAQAELTEEGKTYEVTDLSVEADGAAVDVDASKIVTGDLEENGNYRIEIFNEYGETVNDSPIDQTGFTFKDSLTVNFSLATVDAAAEESNATAEVSTEQTAFLMFSDRDWAYGNWDTTLESATTTVSGDGTYTVTLNAAEVGGDGTTGVNGAIVLCVDVVGLGASVTDIGAITVSDVAVEADGAAVDVDASKIVTGDIEENGNFRIEIFNEYGDTVNDSPIDQTGFTFKDTLSVTFTLGGIAYGAAENTADAADGETAAVGTVDLNGTYNAYIGLQTPTYSFRNAFDDAQYGRDTEYFTQMTGWDGSDPVKKEGTFTDVVIAGNGTYTVSANGLDLTGDFDAQDYFNLIFVSTDIPNTGEITISDMTLNIDGRDVSINPILSPDSLNYVNMLIQNIWNEDVATIGYYAVPPKDVSVTFTVSGFAYDNEAAVAPAETEAAETEAAETDAAENDAEAESAAAESGSSNMAVIVVVVIVVIAVIVAVVVLAKKKKQN